MDIFLCNDCEMEYEAAEAEILDYSCPDCGGPLREKTAEEVRRDKEIEEEG